MSKELEALKNIVKEISLYKLHGLGDENWLGIQDVMRDIDVLEQALTELEELKKRDIAMKPIEVMMTWQCSKCGKEIRNTFNSCPYCRTRIDWSGIYGSAKDE